MRKFLIALMLLVCSIGCVQSETISKPTVTVIGGLPGSGDDVCIAWVLQNETADVGILAARAVLDTIEARMESRHMTACQVVKEPGQFSGYHKGLKMRVTEHMLTWASLAGNMHPVVPGCEYFHAKYVHPHWKNVQVCASIGEQIWYRKIDTRRK